MTNDKMEPETTSRDDQIDQEVDFADIRKDEDNKEINLNDAPGNGRNKQKYLKNVFLGLSLAIIGITILWGGIKLGEIKFFSEKPVTNSSQANIPQNNRDMARAAVVSEGGEPIARYVKNEVKESDPKMIIGSEPGHAESVRNAVAENKAVQSTPKVIYPVAQTESPDATAKPEITTPATIAPTVKPTKKAPKPATKKKAAARVQKKHKEYKVIVGAFSVKVNAESLMGQLKDNNYEPMIVQAETQKGRLYRVIAGSYRSLSIAKIKMGELKALGFQSFFVVE